MSARPEPGSRLGPYEIVAPLGAGGMGEVYRAKDTRLGREVAIKVLPAEVANDPERLRRFEQEARAASALSHPNILTLFDVGRDGETSYLVTELLEGEALRERLSGGPLPVRKAVEIGAAVAHGLAAAHAKGIVHRDLKPENLFLTRDGGVKILDFGLAKLTIPEGAAAIAQATTIAGGTETGVVMGTVGYMAPEQVRGDHADARSDLFALGCVLYEAIAGRRAFSGATPPDTLSAILRDEPPPLSAPGPTGTVLEGILRRCLEKRPDDRFQSARDLGFALEALAGPGSSAAAVTGAASRLGGRRSLLRFGSVAALALGLAVGAGSAWLALRSSESSHRAAEFRRVTFRRGNILHARFAPDGQSIFYGAAWEGQPTQIFSTRIEDRLTSPLGIPSSDLAAVSTERQLLVLRKTSTLLAAGGWGTLAVATASGDAPRDLAESVHGADWLPDGRVVAIRHLGGARDALELPPGRQILDGVTGMLSAVGPRVAPDGLQIATLVQATSGEPELTVVDLEGTRLRSTAVPGIDGFDWHPNGEIWISRTSGSARGVWAIRPDGTLRPVLLASDWTLHDVSVDGRLLLERAITRRSLGYRQAGDATERNLGWLEGSRLQGLSADGSLVLISESGEGAGERGAVYLRSADGSPAVRIADGRAWELSDDGRWALTESGETPPSVWLTPSGAGQPLQLDLGGEIVWGAAALPGPEPRFLVSLGKSVAQGRTVEVSLAGAPTPRLPVGFFDEQIAVSPDGRRVALRPAADTAGPLRLCELDSGVCRNSFALAENESPIQWSADGRFLFLCAFDQIPRRVSRLELATGARTDWLELGSLGDAELTGIYRVRLTRDGSTYAYDRTEAKDSSLFVVEGLE